MARRKHYNYYDDDIKATAVALTEIPGAYATHVAEALDIHKVMRYRWRMEMRRGQIMPKKIPINTLKIAHKSWTRNHSPSYYF